MKICEVIGRLEKLKSLLRQLESHIEDPTKGLPEDVYLFATKITPMINVDLLIRDDSGRILLAWRRDEYYGTGWHIPGGIIRLKETFEERIQKTAEAEIGSKVIFSQEPVEIAPLISANLDTRCHFITLVYECKLPEQFQIDNKNRNRYDTGYLAWHNEYPPEMLPIHSFYKKYFTSIQD